MPAAPAGSRFGAASSGSRRDEPASAAGCSRTADPSTTGSSASSRRRRGGPAPARRAPRRAHCLQQPTRAQRFTLQRKPGSHKRRLGPPSPRPRQIALQSVILVHGRLEDDSDLRRRSGDARHDWRHPQAGLPRADRRQRRSGADAAEAGRHRSDPARRPAARASAASTSCVSSRRTTA